MNANDGTVPFYNFIEKITEHGIIPVFLFYPLRFYYNAIMTPPGFS